MHEENIFETLKNIDFQGGIPTFSKTRQCFLKGIPQDLLFMHRAYNDQNHHKMDTAGVAFVHNTFLD